MSRKLKFRPEIIRIKLNPEQAVLVCDCFDIEFTGCAGIGTVNYCSTRRRYATRGRSQAAGPNTVS